MKNLRMLPVAIVLLFSGTTLGCASSAYMEWERLDREAFGLSLQGHYNRAVVVGQKALAVAEQNLGPDHPSVSKSANKLGVVYTKQGEYAKAEPLLQRGLAIREKARGPYDPVVITTLEKLAELYRATKRIEEAETLERRAAQIRAMKQ